ncbi:hypothetical protein BC831DRAFT_457632 [Entophlyctis helioformis]|nr:hypothetical protein BC831DRAFT_457632 [Entophlyctis helioformis]
MASSHCLTSVINLRTSWFLRVFSLSLALLHISANVFGETPRVLAFALYLAFCLFGFGVDRRRNGTHARWMILFNCL